jgi:hypothetical protein
VMFFYRPTFYESAQFWNQVSDDRGRVEKNKNDAVLLSVICTWVAQLGAPFSY